jgi:hypothetical protein
MSTSDVYANEHVFDGGPPLRIQKSLGLVKPDQPHVVRRAVFAAAIAWIPLAIMVTAQTIVFNDGSATSFFRDFGVYARYLIAIPALFLAESDCIPRLEAIVRHFVTTGLIASKDLPRYQRAVASTQRLLNPPYGDFLAFAAAYLAVLMFASYITPEMAPLWQRGGPGRFSVAGWWNVFISLPLLLILFFGWLWRLVLWARFLVLVAALDLQLIPSHPDQAGGLKFVSSSLRGFRLISLGLGAVVAGAVADRVLLHGQDLLSFKTLVIGLLVLLLILFAGPLTVFVSRLRRTKTRGIYTYGALANQLGREFEKKWLGSDAPANAGMLEKPDFSATTDYFAVAANVYEMRDFPFKPKDLISPLVPALLPFLVVALFTIPVHVVVDSIIKLLL